jgi:hypothetical protein
VTFSGDLPVFEQFSVSFVIICSGTTSDIHVMHSCSNCPRSWIRIEASFEVCFL